MDKYIDKIRELKKENYKLKKYKVFVDKNKDTKGIYKEITNLKNKSDDLEKLKKDFKSLEQENIQLKNQIKHLKDSELSFVNKSKFYQQQMKINDLESEIVTLQEEKKQIYKDHEETFERNKILELIVQKLKDITIEVEKL